MPALQSKYLPVWVRDPPADHPHFVVQQLDADQRTVDSKAILFGRVEKVCDVPVSHVSASRVHACVGFDGTGTLQLGDLGSTHGVCAKASPNCHKSFQLCDTPLTQLHNLSSLAVPA